MSTIFQNINVLDITTASEGAFDDVSKLENVNFLLYSKATSSLLAKVTQQNVNVRAELPESCALIHANGRYEITSLNNDIPLFIMVNGTIVIRHDVTAEALEKNIAGILINGSIFCPDQMKGIVQQKVVSLNGRLVSYMDGAELVNENIRIDKTYLQALKAGSRISFTGKVFMLDEVDTNLLNEKLDTIEFMDKLVIREELLSAISGKIVNAHKASIMAVSKDTYYVEDNLMLNEGVLSRIQKKRIHATGVILIESDIKPAMFAEWVDNLHSDKLIVCRDEMKQEVLSKTADPSVVVSGYTGKLKVVEGDYKLTAAELKYTKEELVFVVHGELDIASDIDPQQLFDSITGIFNYGIINGSGEQYGVIQSKLLINEGAVSDRDHIEEYKNDPSASEDHVGDRYISNANYLKL
ncbi:hypothetical protein [Paenibacillus eucommiae]|uniref:Uncharacterized protein n=1 Tax=Paenibacillus eucommiae TaxID=1355755 RepID=A0ABS4J2V3_9BACL|nr:hypothetical protein [Paenibacillus eucommiae]MBP1994123.1 hypothetical protein [Paenibacillus eucommiae]